MNEEEYNKRIGRANRVMNAVKAVIKELDQDGFIEDEEVKDVIHILKQTVKELNEEHERKQNGSKG